MANVTPPKGPIPIGTVTIAGKRYDVDQWPEFTRFFYDLWVRTGRTTAPTNDELAAEIGAVAPTSGTAEVARVLAVEALGAANDISAAQIHALREELAVLHRRVSDLEAGYPSNALREELTTLRRRVSDIEEGYTV